MASVSAAISVPDAGVIAAISVSGPVERLTRRPGTAFGPAVLAAAGELSSVVTA